MEDGGKSRKDMVEFCSGGVFSQLCLWCHVVKNNALAMTNRRKNLSYLESIIFCAIVLSPQIHSSPSPSQPILGFSIHEQ